MFHVCLRIVCFWCVECDCWVWLMWVLLKSSIFHYICCEIVYTSLKVGILFSNHYCWIALSFPFIVSVLLLCTLGFLFTFTYSCYIFSMEWSFIFIKCLFPIHNFFLKSSLSVSIDNGLSLWLGNRQSFLRKITI